MDNFDDEVILWLMDCTFEAGTRMATNERIDSTGECQGNVRFLVSWYYGYAGKLLVYVEDMNGLSIKSKHGVYDFGEMPNFDLLFRRVDNIENRIRMFFPNSVIENKVCYCESGIHEKTGVPPICVKLNGLWVCSSCYKEMTKPQVPELTVEEAINIERSKMKNSLRFKIMKRDGYVCVICGRGKINGHDVVLNVDHIVPVSKGGKTTEDNLQTLCWDCNIGKRCEDM